MPLLIIKAGPYIAIVLLLGLLALDHYRLIACDSQRQAADVANHQFKTDTKEANHALSKAHADLVSQEKFEEDLQKRINAQSSKMAVTIKHQLAHPPSGNCVQLMGDLAETLGKLR